MLTHNLQTECIQHIIYNIKVIDIKIRILTYIYKKDDHRPTNYKQDSIYQQLTRKYCLEKVKFPMKDANK